MSKHLPLVGLALISVIHTACEGAEPEPPAAADDDVIQQVYEGKLTMAQAQEEMQIISRQLGEQYPSTNLGLSVNVVGMHDELIGDLRTGLWVLLGAVALVLLIACANVTNLLLAATPPPITRSATPLSRQAATARVVSTSTTASWNDAATSATGTGSPARSRASTQRATAVLRPLNVKSYGASRTTPRGKPIASRSPSRAALSRPS